MPTLTYIEKRRQVQDYFDRTAVDAWARMTSDVPLSGIRETVRAGRQQMLDTLLSWIPKDLSNKRILDAGCGTGKFAIEAAKRGAEVVAIDLSPKLVKLAKKRSEKIGTAKSIRFVTGDMLSPEYGRFDHVVAMDSLIHYQSVDAVSAVQLLAARSRVSVLFTFAPRTPLLSLMHSVGRFFPKSDRAPSIEPATLSAFLKELDEAKLLSDWQLERTQQIKNGFYISQAMELHRQ